MDRSLCLPLNNYDIFVVGYLKYMIKIFIMLKIYKWPLILMIKLFRVVQIARKDYFKRIGIWASQKIFIQGFI